MRRSQKTRHTDKITTRLSAFSSLVGGEPGRMAELDLSKKVADRYLKREVLGEGTFGVVYKAIDTKVRFSSCSLYSLSKSLLSMSVYCLDYCSLVSCGV